MKNYCVTPAKAGVYASKLEKCLLMKQSIHSSYHNRTAARMAWIPAFAGMTGGI